MEFLRYIVKRLISAPFIIIGLVTLVFFISRVVPADPVSFMAGEHANPQEIAILKKK
jgi:peptide/nickel transport system permease protein